MARMRLAKQELKAHLQSSQWRDHLDDMAAGGLPAVGPLFSFLLLEPLLMHRAAVVLGALIARLVEQAPDRSLEPARNIVRRFIWHMNEESGNIGWGIPESFAESLAASPLLAREFHRVLVSYVIDLGQDDNYCDHDILRRSCYWAVGRLAQAWPELAVGARPHLRKGLEDKDIICRGFAAWALGQLPPDAVDAPFLRTLAEAGHEEVCAVFDGERLQECVVSALAQQSLAGVTA